jgi:hypothetical protein
MKSVSLFALAALFVCSAALAKDPSITSAPQNLSCVFGANGRDDKVACTWDALAGVTRYAVGVTAAFDLDNDCVADLTQKFDLPASLPTINFSVATLTYTAGDCNVSCRTYTPSAVTLVTVKGLLVGAGKKEGSQSNAISSVSNVYDGCSR